MDVRDEGRKNFDKQFISKNRLIEMKDKETPVCNKTQRTRRT